ncbi:hypothetical protein DFQ04_3086 [Algoriphagus boseongensis]|uniref:Uncharacterized protein n=1 Tax=Algoriphagus boseongensis TaxID=1442587 RepID=A0A4R6T1W7_9BACT|nr:hypothetical protein [Algoriphagus boseongensis]TDQ15200.1 hypothetical protein DFQ04_3086 [Algoriphagus boseongensis]
MDSYFNKVLNAFSTMNVDDLEALLDPSIPYSDVPKEVFLERLAETFESFKEEGETYLICQAGTCCNLYCNPDSIRTAYRFTGEKTRLFLDLRFITEITDDLKDHYIKDIYACHSFQCYQPLDWYTNDISFFFFDDEKADFYKSPELIIHLSKKKEAMNELKYKPDQMTDSELRSWLLHYQPTYDFFKNFSSKGYFSWRYFIMEYDGFLDQINFLELFTKSSILKEIYEESILSEENLIHIITYIEEILMDNHHEYLIWLWKHHDNYFFKKFNFYLVDGIFDEFAKLWAWFKPRQLQLFMKYFAFTSRQTEKYFTKEDGLSLDKFYTLRFHLGIRKKASVNGMLIPFGLWSEELPIPHWSENEFD